MLPEILIADDDADIRSTFALMVRRKGWTCHEAATAAEAQVVIRNHPAIGIVFTDIHMPGESGLRFVERVVREEPLRNIEFVIITGNAGIDEAVTALRLGAVDFLLKPIHIEQVSEALEKCCQRLLQREEHREVRRRILSEIKSKDGSIHSLVQEIDSARIESLEALAIAAEQRDDETGAHIRRIGACARLMAKELGRTPIDVECIGRAAQLHDIGKIGIPDRVLLKAGPLSPSEWAVMKKHAEIGHRIVAVSKSEPMKMAARIALSHHERWDGSGYPDGVSGEAIPIDARIVAICDVYDALRSARPYKPPKDHRAAMKILLEGDDRTYRGQFDPDILDLFVKNERALEALHDSQPDIVVSAPRYRGSAVAGA